MYKYRVLMTSVGGMFGIKNIEAMKKSFPGEVWVIGVDINYIEGVEYIADKFIKVASGSSKEYANQVCEIIKKYKINKILPCSDEEAITLSKIKINIEKLGADLLTTNYSEIKIMSNKISTYKLLSNNNIAVPYYKELNSFEELDYYTDKFYKQMKSFVIKEPVARGNRGTILVDKEIKGKVDYMGSREIHSSFAYYKKLIRPKLDKNFPKIITERLYAPAYDVDVLAKNGASIHIVPRERINPAGVPYKGNIIRNNSNLIDLSKQVAKILKLSFLYDVDIMTRKDGTLVVLEVNPRPSGSCIASIEFGVPLYKDLLQLFDTDNFQAKKVLKDGTRIIPFVTCNIVPSQ